MGNGNFYTHLSIPRLRGTITNGIAIADFTFSGDRSCDEK
jgi:hypothetical protein